MTGEDEDRGRKTEDEDGGGGRQRSRPEEDDTGGGGRRNNSVDKFSRSTECFIRPGRFHFQNRQNDSVDPGLVFIPRGGRTNNSVHPDPPELHCPIDQRLLTLET